LEIGKFVIGNGRLGIGNWKIGKIVRLLGAEKKGCYFNRSFGNPMVFQ
jgi:hypothetical protein